MTQSRQFTKRTNLWVPQALVDMVLKMAERHIPTPKKTDFYAYLITQGLNAWDEGRKLENPNKFDLDPKPLGKFQYYIEKTLVERLDIAWQAASPKPKKQHFFAHIIHLGIEAYYKEHDEFGIRRD